MLIRFCFLFLFSFFSLQAEIEQITFTWRAAECQANCATLLKQELSKIYGAQDVQVDLSAGQATMKWKPRIAFSYYPLNAAVRMVGPHIRDIRVKVKGRIKHDVGNVKLISEGDGTEFFLLGPITPLANQYVPTRSVFNRPLSPEVQKQLIETESKKQMVVLEGPLFEAYRSPPLMFVVENVSIEENK